MTAVYVFFLVFWSFYFQLALMVHMGLTACLHVGTVHNAMFVIRSMVHALVDASLGLIRRIVFARNVSNNGTVKWCIFIVSAHYTHHFVCLRKVLEENETE